MMLDEVVRQLQFFAFGHFVVSAVAVLVLPRLFPPR